MAKLQLFGWLTAAMFLGTSHLNFGHSATFQGLGDLAGGVAYSQAHGISADGKVVVGVATGNASRLAFRWTNAEGLQSLHLLGDGIGRAASGDGSVIVGHIGSATLWRPPSEMVTIGDFPGRDYESSSHRTTATGVSANGQIIVGSDFDDDRAWGFLWTEANGMIDLGSLSPGQQFTQANAISADGSVVVGLSGNHGFLWTAADGMIALEGLPGRDGYLQPEAVSADGSVIVGTSRDFELNRFEAFRWTADGQNVSLGNLGGSYTSARAFGVSADGNVVVGRAFSSEFSTGELLSAFVWHPEAGMQELRSLLMQQGADLQGWWLQSAEAVSGDGRTIVGYGINPHGNTEAFVARVDAWSVPEPSAYLLAAAGICVVLANRMRRVLY
jgi:probable HAF family extracellular repeat protein